MPPEKPGRPAALNHRGQHPPGRPDQAVKNRWTKQCGDLAGTGAHPNGTVVWQDSRLDNGAADNQEWYVASLDGARDKVLLINNASSVDDQPDAVASDKCLDVSGLASDSSDKKGRAPLTIYPCIASGATNGNGTWCKGVPYDAHVWNVQTV